MIKTIKRAVFVLKRIFFKSRDSVLKDNGKINNDFKTKIRLDYDQICIISSNSNNKGFVTFKTINNEEYYLKTTLREIIKSTKYFTKISKSVVLNIQMIKSISKNSVCLENGQRVQVSKIYQKQFKESLNNIFTL